MEEEITIKSYYQNKNFDVLFDELRMINDEIKNLANEKEIKELSAKLYAFYIQLIEIFLINTYAVIENNLWGNIFLSNSELRNKTKKSFFINDLELIHEKQINSFLKFFKVNKELENYKFLEEILREYLHNYQFLNAYKHGLRVENKGESTMSIQKPDSDKWELDIKCDSSVSYLERKFIGKDKDKAEIRDFHIWFNRNRIFVKCKYLVGILKKAKGKAINQCDYSKILSSEDKITISKENQSIKFDFLKGIITKNKN